jgi:hypothetical protein
VKAGGTNINHILALIDERIKLIDRTEPFIEARYQEKWQSFVDQEPWYYRWWLWWTRPMRSLWVLRLVYQVREKIAAARDGDELSDYLREGLSFIVGHGGVVGT